MEEKMSNQGQTSATRTEKFPEPRGWALQWVFAQEAVPSTAKPVSKNGDGMREKFAEPRGWALRWDGAALSEAGERRNGYDLSRG